MNTIIEKLTGCDKITDWKINIHRKESYELFFVKEHLETLRRTDTCDTLVTVYVAHGEYLGDAQFYVYPSTTEKELESLIQEAAQKASLICNPPYTLPENEEGNYQIHSNFEEYPTEQLAAAIANSVFDANTLPNGSLNSVEIFINRHTQAVHNSRGIHKTQTRYDAMVETIPTYTSESQSVELYHQYNLAVLDPDNISREIRNKMSEVNARFHALTPAEPLCCPVMFNIQELSELFANIYWDLDYGSVYSHTNQFKIGDSIQKNISGDPIGLTMTGQAEGSVRSACFDSDGLSLTPVRLIDLGKITGYHGTNVYGQYLGIKPTGRLRCVCVDAGTLENEDYSATHYLEIISMSGLQIDLPSDYIGGEIRLAYLHSNGTSKPLTGISISGKLTEVLGSIRLSRETAVLDGYSGPYKALATNLTIY